MAQTHHYPTLTKPHHAHDYLLWGLWVFFVGYFIIPNSKIVSWLYGVVVFVPLLFCWRSVIILYRNDHLLQLIACLNLYLWASLFWSPTVMWYSALTMTGQTLLMLSFPAAIVLTYAWFPAAFDRLLKITAVVVAVIAIVSIIVFYTQHTFPTDRLWMLRRFSRPDGSKMSIFAVFALLAIYFSLYARSFQQKAIFALCAIGSCAAVVLSQSRASIIALAAGVIVLLARNHYKSLVVVGLLIVILFALFPEGWGLFVTRRGFSARPEIWSAVIDRVGDHRWFGLGIMAPVDVLAEGKHYTSGALSHLVATYRDGGMVACLWLAILCLWALIRSVVIYCKANELYLALLVFAIIAIVPTGDHLLVRPAHGVWMYFWLPLALLAAYQIGNNRPLGASYGK